MTAVTSHGVYYDPYDVKIFADPHPTFRRLREEAPLYYNEPHDFYAVSRFDDVEHVLVDRETFLSCRGDILEMIKAGIEMPPGTLIYEEPPVHTIRRSLLSKVFSPKRMLDFEPRVRDFCIRQLDLLAGADRFDFVADLGAQIPMRVISMLLGIPESDQETIRDLTEESLRVEPGKQKDFSGGLADSEVFADYIDWRHDNPSGDLMTDLITAEFEDETGTVRRLTRPEVLMYVTVLAGAGNETTNRLIGWTGKLLGDHPDARHQILQDRSLIPNAIEEILRYEPSTQYVARYVGRQVEFYGQTVPAGSAILALTASANRDDRQFRDGDRFDIRRKVGRHLTFGYGAHFCLGAALARLEGRVVLDEVLNRFPNWRVDNENAELRPGWNRGWNSMPVFVT